MTWIRVDVYQITERKGVFVFKTKKIRSEWHRIGEVPSNTEDVQYALTTDYKFQKEKPDDSQV